MTTHLLPLLCLSAAALCGQAQKLNIEFGYLEPGTLEARLKLATPKAAQRMIRLKSLFAQAGCGQAELVEQEIPVLSLHSLTQENYTIINARTDVWNALSWSDFYDTYKLVSGLIMYLDQALALRRQEGAPK